ncbi:SAM hydrolase/SAM-dependent halogenase family protein [Flavihumibacter sp. UBA7668]|uniref:SAM hydrolase/SAM-dependent halogenase family protein n=1 Tax=Flavihumibacter sp. UBA7668 TaxID=1946542 RepID=UPI0025B7C3D8|nr:S-adenosyl-l-methionine hydroxide adenosyltransferase family protein [Flavihumibacter sp. UBA7668]
MVRFILIFLFCWQDSLSVFGQKPVLVYQTDFGVKDGAVAAMKGVAYGVSPLLAQYDLSHEIPPYDIWQAAYRLRQTVPYWPAGTVFVSVVDPGVGSARRSVIAKLKTGQFIVTPDNGTLTLLALEIGMDEVRLLEEERNRLPGSSASYTFHGRDLYAYTAARLAAGRISFAAIGPLVPAETVVKIPFQAARREGKLLRGNIPVLDPQYGNIWTNIPLQLVQDFGVRYGDPLLVTVRKEGQQVYRDTVLFGNTFSVVPVGKPVAYANSLLNFSLGINQGNFAQEFKVGSGPGWDLVIEKVTGLKR